MHSFTQVPVVLSEIPIRNVTVYDDRAEVHREGFVRLKEDLNQIVVRWIPASFKTESVRVAVNNPSAIIKNVVVKDSKPDAANGLTALDELDAQMSNINKDTTTRQAQLVRTLKRRSVWDHHLDAVSKCAIPNFNDATAGFTDLLKNFETECKQIDAELESQRTEISALTTEAVAVQDKITALKLSPSGGFFKDIIIDVFLEKLCEEAPALKISYTVHGAQWMPRYAIRVLPGQRQMQMTYNGLVEQCSGEDWKNVNISLAHSAAITSKAIPAPGDNSSIEQPSFTQAYHQATNAPWSASATLLKSSVSAPNETSNSDLPATEPIVQGNKSVFYGAVRKVVQGSSNNIVLADSAASKQVLSPAASLATSVESQEHGFPVLFPIPVPATVPCDSSQITLEVASFSLDVSIYHKCKPNISQHVCISANGANNSSYSLITGLADFYLDGMYIATKSIPTIASLEPFQFWLGEDPSVRVELKPVQKLAEQNELTSRRTIATYKHTFEIQNSRSDQIFVTAVWDISKNNGNILSVSFMDAPSPAPVPGGSRIIQKGSVISPAEVEWCIQIPAQKEHTSALILKAERSIVIVSEFPPGFIQPPRTPPVFNRPAVPEVTPVPRPRSNKDNL